MPRAPRSSGPDDRARRVGRLRLVAQRLVGGGWREPVQPADVIRHLLAAQAQDYPGAKWSIGLRAPGLTDADVEQAIADATIVRSWPMRGTLHFTTAEDLPWLVALLGARQIATGGARRAALGLDDATIDRAHALAHRHLEGRRALTRVALLASLRDGGVGTDGQRGYHVLVHLAQAGRLCFGPMRGKEQTFVLLGEWIARPRRLERDQALAELARRYFEGHGPATPADLAGWSNLPAADLRAAIALARPHLVERIIEGTTYLLGRDTEDRLATVEREAAGSLLLLPGFDEYLLGYRQRGAVLDPRHAAAICPGGNGVFQPTLVSDGQVVGTWRRAVAGRGGAREAVLEPRPFTRLPPAARQALPAAAAAYATYLGSPVRLS